MNLLGTKLDTSDPQVYVVAWAVLTLLLVIAASRLGSFAITTALVVVFGVWLATYGQTPSNTVTPRVVAGSASSATRRL